MNFKIVNNVVVDKKGEYMSTSKAARKAAILEELKAINSIREVVLYKTGTVGVTGVNGNRPISMSLEKWDRFLATVPKIAEFIQANRASIQSAESAGYKHKGKDAIPRVLEESLD